MDVVLQYREGIDWAIAVSGGFLQLCSNHLGVSQRELHWIAFHDFRGIPSECEHRLGGRYPRGILVDSLAVR